MPKDGTGTTKEQWLADKEKYIGKGANPQVLEFIADFLWSQGGAGCETLRDTFMSGYCYFFARMLQSAFRRGKVCHKWPSSHMVWLDRDGIAYDADGVCTDYQELIPVDRKSVV